MKSENGNTRILLTIQGVSPSTTLWHSVDATILSRHSRAFQHTASPDRIAWRVKDPEHSRREQVEPVGATLPGNPDRRYLVILIVLVIVILITEPLMDHAAVGIFDLEIAHERFAPIAGWVDADGIDRRQCV